MTENVVTHKTFDLAVATRLTDEALLKLIGEWKAEKVFDIEAHRPMSGQTDKVESKTFTFNNEAYVTSKNQRSFRGSFSYRVNTWNGVIVPESHPTTMSDGSPAPAKPATVKGQRFIQKIEVTDDLANVKIFAGPLDATRVITLSMAQHSISPWDAISAEVGAQVAANIPEALKKYVLLSKTYTVDNGNVITVRPGETPEAVYIASLKAQIDEANKMADPDDDKSWDAAQVVIRNLSKQVKAVHTFTESESVITRFLAKWYPVINAA